MKKFIKIVLILILALLLVVTLVWQGEFFTLRTLAQVGDNPYLYTMEYRASYDLDDVIEKEVDTNAELLDYVIKLRIGCRVIGNAPATVGRFKQVALKSPV